MIEEGDARLAKLAGVAGVKGKAGNGHAVEPAEVEDGDDELPSELKEVIRDEVRASQNELKEEIRRVASTPRDVVIATPTGNGGGRKGSRKSGYTYAVAPQPNPISRMFPASDEELVVYKRMGGEHGLPGKTAWVGQYRAQDLRDMRTIEQFLNTYVVPAHKAGEYLVTVLNAKGEEVNKSTFTIASRPEDLAAPKGPPTLEGVVAEYLAKSSSSNNTNQQVIEALRQIQQGTGGNGTSQSDIREQLARLERAVTTQGNGPSSERLLIETLLKKLDQSQMQAQMAPPPMPVFPPPAPVPDIGEAIAKIAEIMRPPAAQPQPSLPELMTVVATVFEKLKPAEPKREEGFIEQLAKLGQVKEFMFGNKDAEVERMREQNENLRREMSEIKQALREPQDPLDTIKSVVQINEALKSLANRSAGGGGAESFGAYIRDIFAGLPDLFREAGKTVDKVRERDEAAARRVAASRGQPVPQASSSPRAAPEAEGVPRGLYPKGFEKHLQSIQSAEDPETQIKSVLGAIQALGADPKWKKWVNSTVHFAKQGDPKALEYVKAFLENFEKTGIVKPEKTAICMEVLKANWEILCERLFGVKAKPVEPEAGDAGTNGAESNDPDAEPDLDDADDVAPVGLA